MTPHWADRVTPGRSTDLRSLYRVVPDLVGVVVHQVRLSRFGPALSLRLDLPRFPDNPPPEWSDLEHLQCHLLFNSVAQVGLTGSVLPSTVAINITDGSADRVAVSATGDLTLSFTADAHIHLGRIGAYRDGSTEHRYLGKLERRFTTVPGPELESFHDRF